MGQKVNPHGIRLGIVKDWDARWYADKDFAQNLHEDIKIRDYLKKSLQTAGVPRVETERSKNRLKLTIHTAKPGMVIGRGGSGIEQIKEGLMGKTEKAVDINIAEAFAILKFTPKIGADVIEKVLKSAVSNAENNFDMNVDKLYIKTAYVDQGPTLKRIHPRSRGQAFKILKRTSHVTVAVEER